MKKGTKSLWTGIVILAGFCFGMGHAVDVTAGEPIEAVDPEVPGRECRILEVRIDGEVREEELLYRNTGELKVDLLGEGEPSARLLLCSEQGEQETELIYREGTLPGAGGSLEEGTEPSSELWSASACMELGEGIYFLRIVTEKEEEQELYRSPVLVADSTVPVISKDRVRLEAAGIVCEGKDGTWFSNRETCVSVTAEDAGSGIQKISIYGRKADGAVVLLGEQEWEERAAAQTCSVLIKEEGGWDIGVTAADQSGNQVEEPVWIGRLLVERKAPEVTLTAAEQPGRYGIYREDVQFHVQVRENESGLLKAALIVNGREIRSWNVDSGVAAQEEGLEEEVILETEAFQGEVILSLRAVDRAGNEAETVQTVVMDSVPPEIRLEFGAGKPVNGNYYARPRQARLLIREESFREDGVRIRNGREELERPVFRSDETGEWKEAALVFETDGRYELWITCEDLAGNVGTLEKIEPFVIDRTAPDVQISYGNEEAKGPYFPTKRKALIRVKEANPDMEGFRWSILKDGAAQEPMKAQKLFGWKDGVGSAVLPFEEEGTYVWSLQIVDLAGNCSKVYESETFTLDFTAPFLSLEGVKNGSSNNGEVLPQIRAKDAHYQMDSLKVTVCRDGSRALSLPVHTEEEEGVERICYEDLPRDRGMDGHYRIEARASDLAGNESRRTWQFTVNRFGSEFTFGEEIRRAEETYYVNYVPDIRIVEKNPDNILERRLLLRTEDGVRVLKEGKDYQVTVSGGGEKWNHYLYEVRGNAIAADGVYDLSLYTRDRAGNQMESRQKQAITFCLDRTAPLVSVSGVQDKEVISGRPREICVEIQDNIGVKEVLFRMNGEETAAYDAKEVEEADGVFRMTVTQKNRLQKLEVEAVDLAGNRTIPEPLTFWAVKGKEKKEVEAEEKSSVLAVKEAEQKTEESGETSEEDHGNWKLPVGIFGGGGGMGIVLLYFLRKHRSSLFVRKERI